MNPEGQGCLHFRKNGGNKDKASRKRLESAQTGSGNLPPCLQGLNGAQRWRALGPGVGLLSGLGRLFSPRAGANLQGCPPGPPPRLTSDLSLQPRYQTVMSPLFLISMQKTVSGGPWVEGMGSGGGQEMSHGDRESQKINLFSPKEKGGRTGLPSLGFGRQNQGSAWELETLVQVRVCAVLAVCPGSGHFPCPSSP